MDTFGAAQFPMVGSVRGSAREVQTRTRAFPGLCCSFSFFPFSLPPPQARKRREWVPKSNSPDGSQQRHRNSE